MFDGFKILNAFTDIEALKQNPLLNWQLHVSERTGAIESQTAEYAGIKLTIKGKHLQLRGSLHKYANDGKHNYDDFDIGRIATAVRNLCDRLGISGNSLLNGVEFGVNIRMPFPPDKFLTQLICHKGRPFMEWVDDDGTRYFQCQHEHFIIKIYDKGAQHRLPYPLMRFEIKVLKMQFFRTKGIHLKTIGDLLLIDHSRLGKVLCEYFEDILMDEPKISASSLTSTLRQLLAEGRNPKTWITPLCEEFSSKAEYERARKEQTRRLGKFKELLTNHPQSKGWKRIVAVLIADKWKRLSGKNCPKFTDTAETEHRPECAEFQDETEAAEKSLFVPNLHFKYSVNPGQSPSSDTFPRKGPSKAKRTPLKSDNFLMMVLVKPATLMTVEERKKGHKKPYGEKQESWYVIKLLWPVNQNPQRPP